MKKAILTVAFILAAGPLAAQGTVNFQNSTSSLVRVGPLGAMGTPARVGEFRVALLWRDTDGSFVQLGDSVLVGPDPGLFVGGTRTTRSSVKPGTDSLFVVRAWSAQYLTYEDALASSDGLLGTSDAFLNPTGDPNANPPIPPAPLSGFRGVHIGIPEPTPFYLGTIGLGLLFLPPAVRRHPRLRSREPK